jgi:hypothetical protein
VGARFLRGISTAVLCVAVFGSAVKGSDPAHASQDPASSGDPKDFLDLQKLTRQLNLSPAQQDSVARVIERVQDALKASTWDYARMTCEASAWDQDPPTPETLTARRKKAREEVKDLLKPLWETLDQDQQAHLDNLTQGLDLLLRLHSDILMPCYRVDVRPLFDRVEDRRLVRPDAFTDPSAPGPSQTYADVLKTWTARAFVRESPAPDPYIAYYPDLDVRQNMPVLKDLLIRSPLIAAATLLSPDLAEAEACHLHEHHNPDGRSLDAVRTAYQTQNRVRQAILVRLRLGTPYAASFLARKNWTVYIEDNAGEAYEPVEEQTQMVRPIEAIPVEIPGRTYEAVYQPPSGANRRPKLFWADETERMTYVGNEALVKLFFPAQRWDGTPIITPETLSLRLVIKLADRKGDRVVMTWMFGRGKQP